MSFKNKIILSLALFLLSAFAIFFFRTIPHGMLWDGWSVFFVEKNKVSDEEIVKKLHDAGCMLVVSKSNQTFPLVSKDEVFLKSFLRLAKNSDEYFSRRENYFFDKSHAYAISYVKSTEKKNAQKASGALLEKGIQSGVDAGERYPIAFPLLLFAFAFVLFFMTTEKKIFLATGFFPLAFSCAFPFDASVWSMLLFLCGTFFALRVRQRKNALFSLLHHPLPIVFFLSSLCASFFAGIKAALLFFAVSAGTISILYLFFLLEESQKPKYRFMPVFIRSADAVSFVPGKNIFFIAIVFAVFVFFASLFSTGISARKNYASLALPSAHARCVTSPFPNLRDYVDWVWNVQTMSDQNVRKKNALVFSKPREGDTISFPNYQKNENGIMCTNETMIFDARFYEKTIAQLEKLPDTAFERLMKSQKKTFHPGYSFGSAGSGSALSLAAFFFALAVPLFFFVLFEKGKIK